MNWIFGHKRVKVSKHKLWRVALAGQYQQGKSLVFNLLIGKMLSPVGVGQRTTIGALEYELPGSHVAGDSWMIIDTPGTNHDGDDSRVAREACEGADLVLWITKDKAPAEVDYQFMRECYRMSIPVGLVLNLDGNDDPRVDAMAASIWAQARAFFQPFPLSDKGVLVLRPQLADLSRLNGSSGDLPRRFVRLNSLHQSDLSMHERRKMSGFDDLLSWFCPEGGFCTLKRDMLIRYLHTREEARRHHSYLQGMLSFLNGSIGVPPPTNLVS